MSDIPPSTPGQWAELQAHDAWLEAMHQLSKQAPPVPLAEYPQLALLVWNQPGATHLSEFSALSTYQRHWQWIDVGELEPQERALIKRLAAKYPGSVILPISRYPHTQMDLHAV